MQIDHVCQISRKTPQGFTASWKMENFENGMVLKHGRFRSGLLQHIFTDSHWLYQIVTWARLTIRYIRWESVNLCCDRPDPRCPISNTILCTLTEFPSAPHSSFPALWCTGILVYKSCFNYMYLPGHDNMVLFIDIFRRHPLQWTCKWGWSQGTGCVDDLQMCMCRRTLWRRKGRTQDQPQKLLSKWTGENY